MKMLLMWAILSIAAWISGYLASKEEINYLDKIRFRCVKPHPIIYFICGRPKAPNIPAGVLVVNLLWRQLYGILLMMYGLFLDSYVILLSERWVSLAIEMSPQFVSFVAGYIGTFALSGMMAYGLYLISPYND
jgi:hypothetical protein